MKNENLILQTNPDAATIRPAISPLFLHLTKTCPKPAVAISANRLTRLGQNWTSGLSNFQVRRLSEDSNSSHLVNFPFAFAVFFLLMAGVLGMCCGMVVSDVSVAVVGFILSLMGSALLGWSLSDD